MKYNGDFKKCTLKHLSIDEVMCITIKFEHRKTNNVIYFATKETTDSLLSSIGSCGFWDIQNYIDRENALYCKITSENSAVFKNTKETQNAKTLHGN